MILYSFAKSLRTLLAIGILTIVPFTLHISFATTKQEQSQKHLLTQYLLAATNQRRVALVIGNSRYQTVSELSNPANDAKDIAMALKELGFEVTTVLDADKKQMNIALDKFSSTLTQGTVGVFYYAGHGMQLNGENYLIPIDAQLHEEKDARYETLELGKVQDAMEKAKISIIILDACRNNPFSRRWYRGISSRGLASVEAVKGSFIAFSTAPGQVAEDGVGKNGTFTLNLLKYLKTPNLSIENLFKKTRIAVIEATNNKQLPWESSSLTEDFSFAPISNNETEKPPTPRVGGVPLVMKDTSVQIEMTPVYVPACFDEPKGGASNLSNFKKALLQYSIAWRQSKSPDYLLVPTTKAQETLQLAVKYLSSNTKMISGIIQPTACPEAVPSVEAPVQIEMTPVYVPACFDEPKGGASNLSNFKKALLQYSIAWRQSKSSDYLLVPTTEAQETLQLAVKYLSSNTKMISGVIQPTACP